MLFLIFLLVICNLKVSCVYFIFSLLMHKIVTVYAEILFELIFANINKKYIMHA